MPEVRQAYEAEVARLIKEVEQGHFLEDKAVRSARLLE
jgi:hypothetical protein